jgi:DNA-directed RNA polymerase subunit RPC12/RpoP
MSTVQDWYRCEACEQEFESRQDLRKHVSDVGLVW